MHQKALPQFLFFIIVSFSFLLVTYVKCVLLSLHNLRFSFRMKFCEKCLCQWNTKAKVNLQHTAVNGRITWNKLGIIFMASAYRSSCTFVCNFLSIFSVYKVYCSNIGIAQEKQLYCTIIVLQFNIFFLFANEKSVFLWLNLLVICMCGNIER